MKLHIYGALIVAAVVVAVWVADRRWRARGGEPGTFSAIAMWGVPGGLIGARLYHVLTDYELYTHHPLQALEIWKGGLGIWGGIAGGVFGGWLYIRRHGLDFAALLDCVAPALPLAQAIGRGGNYFNQELFGRPTTLPWGLKVSPVKVAGLFAPNPTPVAYLNAKAFHPTFLYESLWDLAVFGLVLLVERRVRLRKGYLFAVYVSLYTFGRFFTEYLRIDFAHKFLGLRLNDWTSILVFACSTAVLLRRGGKRGDAAPDRDQEPARAGAAEMAPGSTLATTDLQGEFRPPTEDEPPGASEVTSYALSEPAAADEEAPAVEPSGSPTSGSDSPPADRAEGESPPT